MVSASASDLRIGFAGTPEFAATILDALLAAGRRPEVVYCQPDRPAGRGRRLQPPPVKNLALEHALPVRQPPSLRPPAEAQRLAEDGLDVLVVAAYGLILPESILCVPRYGCINVHASLLPRWRGAAPIERAILAGDRETGVCIMRMERGLDTGPVLQRRHCAIDADTTAEALEARLAALGAAALLDCLGRPPPWPSTPQTEDGVTYASKLTRADALVRWDDSAAYIARQVRALARRMPPLAHTGEVQVRLLAASASDQTAAAVPGTVLDAGRTGIRVACGSGVLTIERLQLNVGKGRPLLAADAVNGHGHLFQTGVRLRDGGDPA